MFKCAVCSETTALGHTQLCTYCHSHVHPWCLHIVDAKTTGLCKNCEEYHQDALAGAFDGPEEP